MTKNTKTISRAPDLEDPFSVIIRIMIVSMLGGLASYGVVATIFAVVSSWGDPLNYDLVMIGALMAALLAYSIMSIREELRNSRFMGFM